MFFLIGAYAHISTVGFKTACTLDIAIIFFYFLIFKILFLVIIYSLHHICKKAIRICGYT